MIVKLVRHGESQQQTGQVNATVVGDFHVELSTKGWQQAHHCGKLLGPSFINGSLIYTSPYRRTRQTTAGIIEGSGAVNDGGGPERIYEDPELREIEFGYNKSSDDIAAERELRKIHGWMFYRYQGGESPADCHTRMGLFLHSMMRQVTRKDIRRVLIVTHGMTLRCFVSRFLHLSVEEFDSIHNPSNCDVITIAHKNTIEAPQFVNGKWAVTGLRLREKLRNPEKRLDNLSDVGYTPCDWLRVGFSEIRVTDIGGDRQ